MRSPSGGHVVGWSPARLRLLVGGVSVTAVALAAAAVWGVVQVVDGDPAQSSTDAGEPVVSAAASDEEQQSVTLALPNELAMDQGADVDAPRLLIGRSQNRCRMDCHHEALRPFRGLYCSTSLHHANGVTEQASRRSGAQTYDQAGLNEREFRFEPRTAGG